jgi:hypothetical protein
VQTPVFASLNLGLWHTALVKPWKMFVTLNASSIVGAFAAMFVVPESTPLWTSPSGGIIEEYERVPDQMLKFSNPPYWFPTPVGKPYLRVSLTSQASPAEREHAYAMSLACLTKPGRGCDLPCDYLPLAWRDWQSELEKVGFGAEGFGPYYAARGRCK